MSNRNRVPVGAERARLPTIKADGRLIGHGQQLAARRLQARFEMPVPMGRTTRQQRRAEDRQARP